MNCKDDNVNIIAYCYTSTIGVETEEYLDYANQMDYTKVSTIYVMMKIMVNRLNQS